MRVLSTRVKINSRMAWNVRKSCIKMRVLSTRVKRIYRAWLTFKAREVLKRIGSQPYESARQLAQALRRTIDFEAEPEEKLWFKRIEALRNRLDASVEPITIVDFGAGTPDENRSREEMEQGVEEIRTVGDISRISRYGIWGQMLFKLIRTFKSNSCLEMGTAAGISAAYQAAALQINVSGFIVTLEGAPTVAELADQNLKSLGLDNYRIVEGRFQDTLDQVLKEYEPIDYIFIDGHHDGAVALTYFERIYPHLANRAVLIFDDILYYASMRQAWNTLEADPRIQISVDLARMGICIVDHSIAVKQAYKMPMI